MSSYDEAPAPAGGIWKCGWCGASEPLTIEQAENGYTFGDKEPCIYCGEGTAIVVKATRNKTPEGGAS